MARYLDMPKCFDKVNFLLLKMIATSLLTVGMGEEHSRVAFQRVLCLWKLLDNANGHCKFVAQSLGCSIDTNTLFAELPPALLETQMRQE